MCTMQWTSLTQWIKYEKHVISHPNDGLALESDDVKSIKRITNNLGENPSDHHQWKSKATLGWGEGVEDQPRVHIATQDLRNDTIDLNNKRWYTGNSEIFNKIKTSQKKIGSDFCSFSLIIEFMHLMLVFNRILYHNLHLRIQCFTIVYSGQIGISLSKILALKLASRILRL